MPLTEFELIERYFRDCGAARSDVIAGIGDDAALVAVPPDTELVVATDTLVAGVHFPQGSPAASIGHRALAVNLSDLAAMGARAAWALLALTIPRAEEAWLAEFAAGLAALARAHGVALVGGDTTRGPLTVTVQLLGTVPPGAALRRCGGRAGDALFVSGTPGDAAAGLALEERRLAAEPLALAYLRERFLRPTPRMALGERLRGHASACIDVSDGLLGDAGKLARASQTGVEISFAAVPVSEPLVRAVGEEQARTLALTGGDDYELLFAVHPEKVSAMLAELPPERWGYTRIGALRAAPGAEVLREGTVMQFSHSGYQHFT
ncbi:MAG: thiamine-phosphate kinase [Gammaproteobacteria bacterium]|nr:MAG: thiamine-phosphate kinase [Gammaproteobacteria bacterium]TLZ61370.1 MAG: thiamine-phosphate kinase [Gammaproteobacteria bacterium]